MMFGLSALQLAKDHTVAAAVAFVVGVLAAVQATYFWRKYRG
jgi:hypothetical protein